MTFFPHFLIPFLSLALPLFLLLLLLRQWRQKQTARRRGKILPPSPRKLPFIGNLHQLGSFPYRSLQSLSRRHGPLMLLHLGRVPVLVVSSADTAREVMKNQDIIFSNRPRLSVPDRLFYGSKDVAFSPYGEYWRQTRSVCVLQLLSLKRVQSFGRVRAEETSIMIEKIRRSGSSSAVNLTDLLVSMTNDVVRRVALGRRHGGAAGEKGERLKALFRDVGELLGTFCVGEYIPWLGWIDRVSGLDDKVKKVAKRVDEFLESVFEEHRLGKKGEMEVNFVDILLDFQRESKDEASLVDNNAIKAIIFDMFAAGTDTTSTALEWAMAELLKNPRTMKTLQKEVREVAGSKREIDEDDLEKMPYLKAVIKESLRLHAPVPLLVPREATQDTKILNYDVASGTRVMINAWAIARDPMSWENPEEFCPERFLGGSNHHVDFRGLHFELTPFGAGRRGCPGIAFATAVNELALAKLVHSFSFRSADGGRGEDLDMSEGNGLTVHKKLPLLVVANSISC